MADRPYVSFLWEGARWTFAMHSPGCRWWTSDGYYRVVWHPVDDDRTLNYRFPIASTVVVEHGPDNTPAWGADER